MSAVCRDETFAGLKVKKWSLAGICVYVFTRKLCQIHALLDTFSIKNAFIGNTDVVNNMQKNIHFYKCFLLNEVSIMLAASKTYAFTWTNFSPAAKRPV